MSRPTMGARVFHSRWSSLPLLCVVVVGCVWQRVGSGEPAPDTDVVVPLLFDLPTIYRDLGLLATGDPLRFVASVWFLAGPSPDSTLAVFGLSMTSNALSFRRRDSIFEAQYQVEAVFRRGEQVVHRIEGTETVRVARFRQTLRADESVVFQQAFTLPPGSVVASVGVRDRYGTISNQAERPFIVPRFGEGPALALVPVYRPEPRTGRNARPAFVINPRATVGYGIDTLKLYLEGYGIGADRPVTLRILTYQERGDANQVWSDTLTLEGTSGLASGVVKVPPDAMPLGDIRLEASGPGTDTVSAGALIAFSSRYAVANFDQMLSLLRYIGHEQALKVMRDAPPEQRPALWEKFWKATDPDPTTPANEELEEYFARLQEANQRFRERSRPGWLTDRGEVFITLGEPEEIVDRSSDLQSPQVRLIRWEYTTQRVALDFVDETGFGEFRLTGASRAAYETLLQRVRRSF